MKQRLVRNPLPIMIKYQDKVVLVLICVLVIYLYQNLTLVFFQQDEWFGLAELVRNIRGGFNLQDFTQGHFVPLTHFVFYLEFLLFGITNSGYGAVAIAIHILNVIVFFSLAKRLLQSKLGAYISTTVFATSSVGILAVTWFATNIATLGSSILLMISIITIMDATKSGNRKYIFAAGIIWICSLLFKEDSLSGILLVLVIICSRSRHDLKIGKIHAILLFSIPLLPYLLLRILLSSNVAQQLAMSDSTTPFLLTAGKRVLEIVSQSSLAFVPSNLFVGFLYKNWLSQIFTNELIYQTVIIPRLIFATSTLFFIYAIVHSVARRNLFIVKVYAMIFLSLLPYYFVAGSIAILSPRYLYIPSIFGSLFLGILCSRKLISSKLIVFHTAIIIVLISYNFYLVQRDVHDLSKKSILRVNIVNELNSIIESGKTRQIYYLDGDKINYDPFQSSFGQMLLVLLSQKDSRFMKFLPARKLWDDKSAFYKEGKLIFAYYEYDIEKINTFLTKNNINCSEVVAIRYNSSEQTVSKVLFDICNQQQVKERN